MWHLWRLFFTSRWTGSRKRKPGPASLLFRAKSLSINRLRFDKLLVQSFVSCFVRQLIFASVEEEVRTRWKHFISVFTTLSLDTFIQVCDCQVWERIWKDLLNSKLCQLAAAYDFHRRHFYKILIVAGISDGEIKFLQCALNTKRRQEYNFQSGEETLCF